MLPVVSSRKRLYNLLVAFRTAPALKEQRRRAHRGRCPLSGNAGGKRAQEIKDENYSRHGRPETGSG